MKKEYIIGGLALVGAIAIISYVLKPKAKANSNSYPLYGSIEDQMTSLLDK